MRIFIDRPAGILLVAVVLIAAASTLFAQETAVFAGGCFWGVEGVFEHVKGVEDVQSGYAGGDARTANYNTVSRGFSDHAESVKIVYDPDRISYAELLEIFFTVAHDPTQLNYQGPDHGRQYRSVIFYADETQHRQAKEAISALERRKLYSGRIVTQLTPLDTFYPAESYHQDFMRLNPAYPYVVYWDWPKIKHLKQSLPDFYKQQSWTRP